MRLRWYANEDRIIQILGMELCVHNLQVQARYQEIAYAATKDDLLMAEV